MIFEELGIYRYVFAIREFKGKYIQPINVELRGDTEFLYDERSIDINDIKKFRIGIQPVEI